MDPTLSDQGPEHHSSRRTAAAGAGGIPAPGVGVTPCRLNRPRSPSPPLFPAGTALRAVRLRQPTLPPTLKVPIISTHPTPPPKSRVPPHFPQIPNPPPLKTSQPIHHQTSLLRKTHQTHPFPLLKKWTLVDISTSHPPSKPTPPGKPPPRPASPPHLIHRPIHPVPRPPSGH